MLGRVLAGLAGLVRLALGHTDLLALGPLTRGRSSLSRPTEEPGRATGLVGTLGACPGVAEREERGVTRCVMTGRVARPSGRLDRTLEVRVTMPSGHSLLLSAGDSAFWVQFEPVGGGL